MFAGQRGSVDFYNRGVGNVLKKKELDKRRVEEKIEGLPLPQSDYGLYAMYCTYWFLKFYNVYI